MLQSPHSRFTIIITATFFALTTGSAFAQTTSATNGSTPSGLTRGAPAGSYSLSGFDNVNLFNGNLNASLPLLQIGGRGGARTVLALGLNSKGWRVDPQICDD